MVVNFKDWDSKKLIAAILILSLLTNFVMLSFNRIKIGIFWLNLAIVAVVGYPIWRKKKEK